MQTTPDDFMSADAGADPGASVSDPGATAADPGQPAADPSADPSAGGGDFISAGAAPEVDDAQVAGAQHGAAMAGVDATHPVSGEMLTTDDSAVSPDEQHAYDDLVTRCLLFINDPRKPAGKGGQPNEQAKAPRDVIIDHLNVKGMPADVAVGRTTAQVIWLMFSNAKHQGVDYPPDVLYHGADEVMSHIYEIGVKSGAIKNPPPPDSPEEQKLLGMAKMYATQFFGNNVIDAGMNNQDEARAYYQSQMQREADTGALENWSPSDSMTPEQLTGFLARASQGKAALADQRYRVPTNIQDFRSRGAPTLMPPGGPNASQPAQPPPDQGEAPPPDQQGAA